MRDRGWSLTYPGVEFIFGGVDYVADKFQRNIGVVSVRGYEVSDVELTTEDAARPRRDGLRMGQDYRRGRTHTFTLGFKGRSRLEVERMLGQAERAWRGDGVRDTPGVYAELSTLRDGVVRSVVGRPRRFAPNYDLLSSAYEATALCTFDTRDDLWLGPEQQIRVDLRAITRGGFTFPFTFPLVMSPATTRQGTAVVGGTLPAFVALDLHGPIVNPDVRLTGGWRVRLQTALKAGRVVTIDAEQASVVDEAGASYAGTLARDVRLPDLQFQPGQQNTLALSGTDSTRTAYLVARWRDTFAGRQ